MGYSLKEALKAICGVNQWSYAVFWKIGRQNPNLLIWEDCYYEVMPCSVLPNNSKSRNGGLALEQLTGFWHPHEAYTQPLPRVGEELDFLVNKMMITNQVHVVGDGLVGRTAFTGNHEWIVSGSFSGMAHPPKVLSEVHLQFSAGMQTIAVIPVLPHGVVQLGSSLTMKENLGFVQDVKTLILQLACAPSELSSGNKMRDAPVEEFMFKSVSLDPYVNTRSFTSDVACDRGTQFGLFQDLVLANQTSCSLASKNQDKLNPTASSLEMYNQNMSIFHGGECQPSTIAKVNSSHALKEQVVSSSIVQSQIHCNENQFSDRWTSARSGIQTVKYSKKITDGFSSFIDQPVTSDELSDCFADGFPDQHRERGLYEGPNIAVSKETDQIPSVDFIPGFNKTYCGSEVPSCVTSLSDIQPSAGEDLFDALGVDFKNKILNRFICEPSKDGPPMVDQIKEKPLNFTSFTSLDCEVMSESGMFSTSGSDHLLDAVVSGVQSAATQSSSENLSCRTTLTKGSINSVPSSSAMDGLCSISHQMDELFGLSRPSISSMDIEASFTKSVFGKNDATNCAQTMTYSGSRVSSRVDQGPTVKLENTVATANSKKLNIGGKPMRKRMKPGENPRPRPKDRQMIQDRLKELRDMIPNGAKCSIDALLERTIKHMLFLQNVSKHADKLKQTVESKIIDKDGGLLLKDDFEGGATWAYEVDSQARMCPIIVEDLHTPHHFLVEMLCEERGFFLEIADVIRGMGLTILKGVIQKRDDKIWAHFAVEANREITRMDIFVSLVHLLENTIKSSNIPTNDDHDTFISPTFEPTTSVRGN